MDHASEAEELLSQFRSALALLPAGPSSSSTSLGRPLSLPSARQWWTIGGLLYRFTGATKGGQQHREDSDLLFAYGHLVESLPDVYWTQVLETFQSAVHRLLQLRLPTPTSSPTHDDDDFLLDATKSLNGLFTNSPRLCQLAFSNRWVSILSALYDRFVVRNDPSPQPKQILLATLSSLLLDGLFLPATSKNRASTSSSVASASSGSLGNLEEELLQAIQVMEEQSTDCLGDLLEWQTNHEPFRRTIESQVRDYYSALTDHDDDPQQRDYILNMLESARPNGSSSQDNKPLVVQSASSQASQNKKERNTKPVSAADELERRVQQIKQILPEFGEGFIETALSLHQGNVETTMAILLNDPSSYPSALRGCGSIPSPTSQGTSGRRTARRNQGSTASEGTFSDGGETRTSSLCRAGVHGGKGGDGTTRTTTTTKQPRRSEYDDDYDDQYDELDVRLGGADEGQYDFEKVKLYNQFVRSEEREDSFWQENANTIELPKNKDGQQHEKHANGGDEPSWGRDKIKGGRTLGADGKVDRKPGGQRGKNNNRMGGGGGGGGPTPSTPAAPLESSKTGVPTGETAVGGANKGTAGKPRTKPKSQNRVTRQRDKKQKAQGTFGAAP